MTTKLAAAEPIEKADGLARMIEDFFGVERGGNGRWLPATDIKETDAEYLFVFDLPGLTEDQVTVEVVGDVLKVAGKRELNHEEKRDDFVRIERSYGSFQRSFLLGSNADASKVDAAFKNGVLTVTVPKDHSTEPHRVQIKAS